MVTKKIAVFPGSFDPMTLGHFHLIKRAAALFDEVIVSISTNTSKHSFFSPEEKMKLAQEALLELANVKVYLHQKGLSVAFAKEHGAKYMIRGIRNVKDYEYEKEIAFMNQKLAPEIETVFLLADAQYSGISSSIVKEIAINDGEITAFVPVNVAAAMKLKIKRKME